MEKKKKFLSLAVAAFAACLIALGAMLCVPAVASAEETSDLVLVNTEKAAGAFNSIRVTVPVNVNKENEWYGSAGLYFGLADNGGTADLSSFSALKLRVRGVTTTNFTKVRMIVIDENGNARWVKETSSTSGGTLVDDNGGSITIDGTYDYHGMPVGGKNGWYVVPKDKFTTFANDSAAYGTMGTFDWTKVKYVVADMFTTNLCTVEVGDLKGVKTDNSEVELFNVSKANMFDADADTTYATAALNKNEFFFGPARTHLDKFWNGTYASGGTYTKFKDIACSNGATTTVTMERRWYDADVDYRKDVSVGDLWVKMATAENPTNTDIDLSEYGGIAFNVNVKTASNVKVDTLIRAGGLDYRAYGNKQNVYTVAENGDYKTNKDLNVGGNVFTTGFKGNYYIPFGAFEAGSGEDIKYASAEKLATSNLFFIANSATFANGDAITISNVRAVVDPEATAKIVSVDNSLTYIAETEITASNYSSLKKLFEDATATYQSLSDTNKAKITDAENRFAAVKSKFDAYAVNRVQQMIDALVTEIIAENYVSAKRNYVSVRNEYEALTDEQKARITNDSKFDEVKAAIEAFESTKADEIALIDANTGNSDFSFTIETEQWGRIGLAKGDVTMDLSFSRGFAFDIETNSEVNVGLTVFFYEDGKTEYIGNSNGIFVSSDGTYKTGKAEVIPAGFKGRLFLPWEAFVRQSNIYASSAKAANVKIVFRIDKNTTASGATLKLSNFRLSNGIVTSATVLSIDKSLTYLTDTEMSANNYLDLKGKFAETKAKYDSLTDTDKAKINNAESRFAAIETKFNDGSASIVQQMINELPDEIAAENYEEAKTALKDAQSAYDGLTAEQKASVNKNKLESTVYIISLYEAGVVQNKINALTDEITKDNYVTAKRNYVSVRNEYEALTDDQKESVTNADKLDEVKETIEAFESTKADEIALVDGETGSSGFDLTIGIEAIWKRLGLAGGDQTMDLSFSKGFAFDIETNSDVNAGLTVYFRENGESAKQYGGYGNKTFGMYVYSDGTCKTNSALGIGANLIPAGFKGTIFLPWEAFEKGKEYASAEKAANVKLLLFIDKTFGIGTTLKISNFRLSNGISTSATVLSVDRTFGYIDGEAISDENYAKLNSRFVAAKGNYDALTAENKAKVTNADKIGSIEAKLETYRLGYAIAKIDACLTEVNADNYETAKTLLVEAKKAYGALTEASKGRVTNAATIATATAAIETYEASLTDAKLDALPETVNSGNIEEAKLALEEAKAEYDGLDDGVKSKVTKSDKIAVLEEKIDVYEAGKVDALIAALTDKIDKDNYKLAKKNYIAAQKAYGNLSANGKTKVANAAKFAAVKAAIEKYENTDQVNVAAIILIAAGAVIAIGGAVMFVLIKSKTKKRG